MNNKGLRIISGIIVTIALAIVAFCLYIIPYAFFDLNYEIPEFLLKFVGYLERVNGIRAYQAYLLILFGLILLAIILFMLAAYIEAILEKKIIVEASHPIDPVVATMADQETRALKARSQFTRFPLIVKYLAAIMLLLLILELVEYLITRVQFGGIF